MTQKKIRYSEKKQGYCNICGKFRELTFDHVPPKGCVGITSRNAAILTAALNCKKLNKHNSRQFQNGLKFKSLCKVCNNDILGHKYDPDLNKFAKKVANYSNLKHKYDLSLPTHININIKPQRVVRAIVGHLLAAEVRKDMSSLPRNAAYPEAVRQYILNPSASVPEKLEVYYWLYPSDIQVIILGAGVMSIGHMEEMKSKRVIISEFIKFYPLAFWVTWDQPKIKVNLHCLTRNKSLGIDEKSSFEISSINLPRIDWPENPSDNEIVIFNDNVAYFAKKKRRRKAQQIN